MVLASELVKLTTCLFYGTICIDHVLPKFGRVEKAPFADTFNQDYSSPTGVKGQIVVTLEGETATFTDVTIPGTGGTVVSTAAGQNIMQLSIFGSSVYPAFENRVSVTNYNNGFRDGLASFVIRNVQRADAGTFQCTSQFESVRRPCGQATLVVPGPPNKPTISPLTSPVLLGGDVVLQCSATSTSLPADSVLKLAYNLKENGRLALATPTTASRFKIAAITKAKTGSKYACVAYELNTQTNTLTGLNSVDSDEYTLNPQYPPGEPVFNPPATSYTLSSNDTVPAIICSADCNPACSINWYKEQQIFQSGNRLTLGQAETRDAGNYFCRAANALSTADKPLSIVIQDSVSTPELIPSTATYSVPEGTTIPDIFCRANCTPACSYTWSKNGTQVSTSQDIRLGSVESAASGTYTCRASNGQSTSTVAFVLDVLYGPRELQGRNFLLPNVPNYRVVEGTTLLHDISCAADCNPRCNVTWTRTTGGQPVLIPGHTLALGSATRNDTGSYTCTLRNQLGAESARVEVEIEFRPEQVTLTPATTAYSPREGVDDMQDIRCSAICNPPCAYEWYKANAGSTPVATTAVLSLGTADRSQSGTFTCRASNKLGELTRAFNVNVLYGPEQVLLTPPQGSYIAPIGPLLPPLSVSCSAQCNPACTYRWVKDDAATPTSTSGTLSIGQADNRTAGIYKCLASNQHGNASEKFSLAVQYGPTSTVTFSPPETLRELAEGEALTVTCSAACDPACSFRWEDASGAPVTADGTLSLQRARREDAGSYTCVATNGVGSPARKTLTLRILVGPSGRVIITPAGPLSLKRGNSAVLSCSAECSPACTFTWLKGAQVLTSSGGILTLNDVDRADDGTYTCAASNSVSNGTKSVLVEIQYGPGDSIQFQPDSTSHPVTERGRLSVSCGAECKPACAYVWKRGSAEVARSPVLLLENVQRAQGGTYSCTANNVVNQPATRQIVVDVLYGPSGVSMFPNETQLYPVQGSGVSLKCWATCNPECSYTWYKGNTLVPDPVDGELDLRNVTTATSGSYLCVASNDVGTPARRSVELSVRAGPGTTIRFNPPDDTAVVAEGRLLKVDCIAECFPACWYEWRKGSLLVSNRSTLEFPATDRTKAGNYLCYASNDANSQASKPLTVEVQYGPGRSIAVFPPGQNQTYTEGAPFSVKCSADCSPACTYKWYLGSSLLPFSDGILYSDAAAKTQAGTYSCQASNGIGSAASISVVIDVQTGPGRNLQFTPPGDRQMIREGGNLAVTCSAQCSPACTYRWTFDNQEVPSTNGRLQIAGVTRVDKGTYSCIADNGYGNQGTKALVVDVQYGPEGSVEVFPSNASQVLNEGASIFLKCSADCSPKCAYRWFHGNALVNSSAGTLSLVAVGPENGGTYRCTAENSVGLASSDIITIVVQTGPGNSVRIEPEGDVYNVTEGGQLRMRCSAQCSPVCTYTWYFGFERVKSPNGLLVIDGVQRNISGPFVCYAANEVGLQGSRLIQVDVTYGPVDGIVLDPNHDVTVLAESPFSLRCSANCHPPCEYMWYQGPLPRPSAGGRLSVAKAAESDGGSYTCRASNRVATLASDPVNVQIQYGPRDTIRLSPEGATYVVSEGNNVTVTCSANCKPACQYTWYAGTEQVISQNGTLVVSQFSRDLPRFYSCFADNGFGAKAMTSVQVKVQYGPGERPTLFPNTSPLMATIGGSLSVQCSADCSPPCNYTWSRNGAIEGRDSVLQIPGVQPTQGGTYLCTASNGVGGPSSASVDVQIQTGTGVTVRFQPPALSATVREGEAAQVRCVADCLPACNFTWSRDGSLVSQQSLLSLENTQRTQSGVYVCNARNSLGVNASQQLFVNVEYGPTGSVKLFPPETTASLKQGETLIVQCSAQCSPPCSFSWRKDQTDLPSQDGVLTVRDVTPDDNGRYTCTANNQRGAPQSVNLTVNVSFGPENSVTLDPPGPSQTLKEGDTLMVRCSAECLPACKYAWYLGSKRLSEAGDGVLNVPALTREEAGTYTCHADNGVGRRMTKDFLLDVQYGPGTPTFSPEMTSYTVRESLDSVSDVRCSAECSPRCEVQWFKDGRPADTVGNILTLETPSRSADGIYTCVASNKYGSKSRNLTVHVNYAPSIASFTLNNQTSVVAVQEQQPVTFLCQVDGKPKSTLQLFNGSISLNQSLDAVQVQFTLKQVECLDGGTYICTADNGVGAPVSQTAELKVLCQPRLDPRVYKLPFVASELGQNAVISVPVLAQPPPSFLWYKVRDGVPSVILEANNSSLGHSDKYFTVNGSLSTLTIRNVQLTDFGDYVVSIANERGTTNLSFSLVPQSAPYVSRNLTTRPVDAYTVEVTWSPGFNGGAKQQFLLDYLKQGTNGWRTLELDPRIDDVTRSLSVNVSDLNPSTSYTFRLRSRNAFGVSEYSNAASALTQASAEAQVAAGEVSPTPILLGVGLALGFLVGAGITAIVVVSKCRTKPKNAENMDDYRSDTTYDTLYLRDALWAQRHIKMRQSSGSYKSDNYDGYDFKQPDDTVRGFNDYSPPVKPVGEIRTIL